MLKEALSEIGNIPIESRRESVSAIQNTIAYDRVRIQYVKDKAVEMWGFFWLKDLPFCFRVWPYIGGSRVVDFLKTGTIHERTTKWWFLAPCDPLKFSAPIFTKPIEEDDMEYLLKGLGTKGEDILKAKDGEKLKDLYRSSLLAKKDDYDNFFDQYKKDPYLRMSISAAVDLTCNEIESNGVEMIRR